jgi:prepilin-type N-terminal cleavage/methylation domain-containing protein
MMFKNKRGFTLTELAIVIGVAGSVIAGVWIAAVHVSLSSKVNQASNEIRYIVSKIQSANLTNPNFLHTIVADGGCSVSYKVCPASTCVATIPITTNFSGCPSSPPCGAQCYDPSVGCTSGLTPPTGGGGQTLTTILAAAGIFPQEMISGTAAAPVVHTPWYSSVGIAVSTPSTNECSLASYGSAVAAAQATAAANAAASGTTQTITVHASNAGAVYAFQSNFFLYYYSIPKEACTQLITLNALEWIKEGLIYVRVASNYGSPTSRAPLLSDFAPANIAFWCSAAGTPKVDLTLKFYTNEGG